MAERKHRESSSQKGRRKSQVGLPAVLFDLDGTLVDSVYQHIDAWSEALRDAGINFPDGIYIAGWE